MCALGSSKYESVYTQLVRFAEFVEKNNVPVVGSFVEEESPLVPTEAGDATKNGFATSVQSCAADPSPSDVDQPSTTSPLSLEPSNSPTDLSSKASDAFGLVSKHEENSVGTFELKPRQIQRGKTRKNNKRKFCPSAISRTSIDSAADASRRGIQSPTLAELYDHLLEGVSVARSKAFFSCVHQRRFINEDNISIVAAATGCAAQGGRHDFVLSISVARSCSRAISSEVDRIRSAKRGKASRDEVVIVDIDQDGDLRSKMVVSLSTTGSGMKKHCQRHIATFTAEEVQTMESFHTNSSRLTEAQTAIAWVSTDLKREVPSVDVQDILTWTPVSTMVSVCNEVLYRCVLDLADFRY